MVMASDGEEQPTAVARAVHGCRGVRGESLGGEGCEERWRGGGGRWCMPRCLHLLRLPLMPLWQVAHVDGRRDRLAHAAVELGDPRPHDQREREQLARPHAQRPRGRAQLGGGDVVFTLLLLHGAAPHAQYRADEREREAMLQRLPHSRGVPRSRPSTAACAHVEARLSRECNGSSGFVSDARDGHSEMTVTRGDVR